MRRLLCLVLMLTTALEVQASRICSSAEFSLDDVSANGYEISITMWFTFGTIANGPKIVHYADRRSNDTAYIDAFVETRGLYSYVGFARTQNASIRASTAGIRVVRIVLNELQYPSIGTAQSPPDTFYNAFDSVFVLAPTRVPDALKLPITIHPNPVNRQLNIHAEENLMQVDLVNFRGQLVFRKNVSSTDVMLDLIGLSSGLYQVVMRSNTRRFSLPVTIAR